VPVLRLADERLHPDRPLAHRLLVGRRSLAGGIEYEVDCIGCIVFASGFAVGTPIERRAGDQVYGRGGRALSEKWREGVATLHGMQTRGFPNCFPVGTAQAGVSANFPHTLEVQSRHIAYLIRQARERAVLIRRNGNFGHGIMASATILADRRTEGSLTGLALAPSPLETQAIGQAIVAEG
jgi:hypothetical protein